MRIIEDVKMKFDFVSKEVKRKSRYLCPKCKHILYTVFMYRANGFRIGSYMTCDYCGYEN